MIDISTKIAGVKLDGCVFNASGVRDETLLDLENLAKSKSCAVLMKSCTLAPRKGNPAPRCVNLKYGSINSMGLPNLGYRAYIKFSKILEEKYQKPLIASICGLSPKDNIIMFKAFNDTPVDLIEFNPGSPNTIGKPIVGYDFEQMDNIIKKYPVKFVTCVNSIGNGLAINPQTEKVLIKPKGGLGGIAGGYIKYTALANVRMFYQLLADKIQVIGVGGVYSGIDAFEMILAGASAVQIGTAFLQKGPGIFARVQNQLSNFMKKKGYQNLADFRGKLNTLD